jgi:hypothetical protein
VRRAGKTALTYEQAALRLRTILMAVSLAVVLTAVVLLVALPEARLLARVSSYLFPK